MAAWNPADIRRRNNLSISPAERARIEANFAPMQRDAAGLFDADAVFEGGGVLGTAFLGAARVCHEVGIRWHALAGTSAGAITASLLAADLNIDTLEQVVGQLDFLQLLSEKSSRLIFNGDPSDDLDHPVQLISNLYMVRELGQYSTEPFKRWLDDTLRWCGKQNFGDVWDRSRYAPDRQLKVVITDLSRGEMRVLPDELDTRPPAFRGQSEYRPPLSARQRQFSVAEAVRLSMSIPFFFQPGVLDNGDGSHSVIVDGGLLSNFPLWIFDEDVPGKPPAWPTFGFRLVDRTAEKGGVIKDVTDLLKGMLKTMMLAGDRRYLSQRHQGRVVDLDLTGLKITATDFALSNDAKDLLYMRGYLAAKAFFLEQWNWKKHLELRGFPVVG